MVVSLGRLPRALMTLAPFVTALGATRTASPDGPRLARWKLEIDAPDGCISAPALRDAVTRTLTRDPFIDVAPDGTLRVTFARAGASWTVVLGLRTVDGTELGAREISREAAECRSLDAAVVLVTAMLVDAARAHEPAPIRIRAEPAAALAPPGPIAAPTVASEASASGDSRTAATFTSGLGVTLPFGLLPSPSLAPSSWLRVARDRWWAGEVAVAWFARVRDEARPGGVFDGGHLSLGLCPELAEGRAVRLVGCARGALAVMRGTGTAVTLSESATVLFGELGLGARVSLHLIGPLWIASGLDGWLPVRRPSFTVRSPTGRLEVFSPSVVFATATLGLELRAK